MSEQIKINSFVSEEELLFERERFFENGKLHWQVSLPEDVFDGGVEESASQVIDEMKNKYGAKYLSTLDYPAFFELIIEKTTDILVRNIVEKVFVKEFRTKYLIPIFDVVANQFVEMLHDQTMSHLENPNIVVSRIISNNSLKRIVANSREEMEKSVKLFLKEVIGQEVSESFVFNSSAMESENLDEIMNIDERLFSFELNFDDIVQDLLFARISEVFIKYVKKEEARRSRKNLKVESIKLGLEKIEQTRLNLKNALNSESSLNEKIKNLTPDQQEFLSKCEYLLLSFLRQHAFLDSKKEKLIVRKVRRSIVSDKCENAFDEIFKSVEKNLSVKVPITKEVKELMSEARRLNLSRKEAVVENEKNDTKKIVKDVVENNTPKKSAEQLADEERTEKLNNYLENPDLITPEVIFRELENQGFSYSEKFKRELNAKWNKIQIIERKKIVEDIIKEKFTYKKNIKTHKYFYSIRLSHFGSSGRLYGNDEKVFERIFKDHKEYENFLQNS